MEEAGVQPSEVEYINAHGTSTHHNDLFETRAIHKAFGDAAKNLVVNSTKSMIGHLLGAAGGVEFVTCVKSLEEGFIHQTVGTTEPDEPELCDRCSGGKRDPLCNEQFSWLRRTQCDTSCEEIRGLIDYGV